MANKNINNLPTATSLNAGDKLEILQGGTNKQIDVSLLSSTVIPTLQQVTDEGASTTNEIPFKDGLNNDVAVLGSYQFNILNDALDNSLFNVDRATDSVTILGEQVAVLSDIPSIAGLAPINSPTFTGTPLAPTPTLYDATTQIATTEWVRDNAGGCLYRNTTGGTSVTGVTTQQLVDEHLIAGGVMESGWDLLNEIYLNKDLDNGTFTVRVLYNSTNSLSGATTLATYTSNAANNQASFIRNFGVISPTVTELFLPPTTSSVGDFIGTSNIPVTQLNIDWTQPIYILWSIQNSSILDTSVISRNKLWKK